MCVVDMQVLARLQNGTEEKRTYSSSPRALAKLCFWNPHASMHASPPSNLASLFWYDFDCT